VAVAGLVGIRNVKDDADISYDADPVDVTWFVQGALDRNALVDDDGRRLRGRQRQHCDAARARPYPGPNATRW
jgi:hypothetical protein